MWKIGRCGSRREAALKLWQLELCGRAKLFITVDGVNKNGHTNANADSCW